jgi:hypothetical protein
MTGTPVLTKTEREPPADFRAEVKVCGVASLRRMQYYILVP